MISEYEIELDEEVVLRAIKSGQLDFLYCVFCYNKNYMEVFEDDGQSKGGSEDSLSDKEFQDHKSARYESEDTEGQPVYYKTFTFDFLFRKTLEFCEEQSAIRIRAIANWKIQSSESILRSLLVNNQDQIACDFSEFYL